MSVNRAKLPATTAVQGGFHLRKIPNFVRQTQHILQGRLVVVVAVIMGLITLLIQGYRLSAAPDVFSDEGIYLLVSTNLARGLGLTLNHQIFLWHPPVYFLVEAAYIKLAGLINADPLTILFSVRCLNIFFSAIITSFLLLFGCKLHSFKAGLIAATLFLIDPYVQRINRRNMLETLAMLFLLFGFYIFFSRRSHLKAWQWVGAGIAFGLSILTKEVMFLYLFALLAIIVWAQRTQLGDAIRVVTIAFLLYLFYPLWMIVNGEGSRYLFYQLYGIERITGWSITGHGSVASSSQQTHLASSSQQTHSLENVQNLLGQYGTSYLLIALAGIFSIILLLRFRHRVDARYLSAWSIFSFAFGIILGRVSDQYFYFLMLPVVLVNGYCLAIFFESTRYRRWWSTALLLFFLGLLLIYNGGRWIVKYASGFDNGYTEIIAYVRTHIPPGTTIVVSDDVSYYLLSPQYDIRLDRDEEVITKRHESYFIMSSKDRWGSYNATTPEFYDWVVHNSQALLVVQDDSFWQLGLYRLSMSGEKSLAVSSSQGGRTKSGGKR